MQRRSVMLWTATIISMVLVIVPTYLVHDSLFHDIDESNVFFLNADDTRLHAAVYKDSRYAGPLPTVIVCHGLGYTSSELLAGYSVPLARRGFLVLALDFRGHGQSGGSLNRTGDWLSSLTGDVLAAVQYLKNDTDCSDRIGILGYSLGGHVALDSAAMSNDVSAVVSIAAIGSQPIIKYPHNVLIIDGETDILMPESEFDSYLRAITHISDSQKGVFYGNFSDGSARQMKIIGKTHLDVVENPDTTDAVIDWFNHGFQVSNPVIGGNDAVANLDSIAVSLVAMFVLGICICKLVLSGRELKRGYTPSKRDARFALMFYFLACTVALLVAVPLMWIFDIIPFRMAGFVFALIFGLFIAELPILVYYSRLKKISITKREFGSTPYNVTVAVIVFAVFITSGISIMGWRGLRLIPPNLGYTAVFFAMLLPATLLDEYTFRILFQERLRYSRFRYIYSGLAQALCRIVPVFAFSLVMFGMSGIIFLFAYLVAALPQLLFAPYLYDRSMSIISSGVYYALCAAWLLSCMLPAG